MSGIYPLVGVVKNYDWGGYSYIPDLLGLENEMQEPFAEYWLGTHPLGQAMVKLNNGRKAPLQTILHPLPFLLKVLDVKEMLSIQVHPTREKAEQGFLREEKEGIPVSAPHRLYKDRLHKPELMVALSDFWLLQGFKQENEIASLLNDIDEFKILIPVFKQGGVEALYQYVMQMPQEEVNRIIQKRLAGLMKKTGNYTKEDADYWVLKAAKRFCTDEKMDRGIFSIYFFNLIQLKKGEGIFQDNGMPHAYLEGQNVEIMANSDNVLRGGLTNKHIDVDELLRNINFKPNLPQKIIPSIPQNKERVYSTKAKDFALSCFILAKGEEVQMTTKTTTIFLLIDGQLAMILSDSTVLLEKGNPSAVVLPGREIHLTANQDTVLFKATNDKIQVE